MVRNSLQMAELTRQLAALSAKNEQLSRRLAAKEDSGDSQQSKEGSTAAGGKRQRSQRSGVKEVNQVGQPVMIDSVVIWVARDKEVQYRIPRGMSIVNIGISFSLSRIPLIYSSKCDMTLYSNSSPLLELELFALTVEKSINQKKLTQAMKTTRK